MSHDRAVFVDDSGVRRVVLRSMWVLSLVTAVLLLIPGSLNLVMADVSDVGSINSTGSGSPYAVSASAMALPRPSSVPSGCTFVTGEVFIDWDLNGWRSIEAEAERGVAGMEVVAFDETGAAVASASTAEDGRYRLELAQPRRVRVEFSSAMAEFIEAPIGLWSETATQFPTAPDCTANLGVVWRRSVVDPVDSLARVGVGQTSGHAWIDSDCDRVLDPGEPGASAYVELRDATSRSSLARTSTDSGAFVFAGLQPGVAYEVALPHIAVAHDVAPSTVRSRIDGSLTFYSGDESGWRATFVLEEQGQSRHGLRFPVTPPDGCAASVG